MKNKILVTEEVKDYIYDTKLECLSTHWTMLYF